MLRIVELIKLVAKSDKMLGKHGILALSPTRLINSIKQEHSFKILYLSPIPVFLYLNNAGATFVSHGLNIVSEYGHKIPQPIQALVGSQCFDTLMLIMLFACLCLS